VRDRHDKYGNDRGECFHCVSSREPAGLDFMCFTPYQA